MDAQIISDLFMIFNVSGDGSMSKQEFVYCWNGWIKKIVRPRTAIIIVDVQVSDNLDFLHFEKNKIGKI